MRKLIPVLLISVLFCLTIALFMAGPTSAQAPDTPSKGTDPTPIAPVIEPLPPAIQIDRALLRKIEPQLLKKFLESNNKPVPFIVYLRTKADLEAAVAATSPAIGAQGQPDRLTKRIAIVNALQETARNTQAGVLQTLRTPPTGRGGLSGQSAAADIKSLWIVNAVAAKGLLATVLDLAARPDVEVVRLDKQIKLPQPQVSRGAGEQISGEDVFFIPSLQTPEWGISKIRADLVHNALNIDGSGVVVANIDSGVDWQHPALQTKYRGYTGSGKLPQHTGNWYDATGIGSTYPVDGDGHGTHTMGTMVGNSGIGVAPGARWIAVQAFSGGTAQNSWLHDAFQWILAPNGDPTLAPDIVNNSWGSSLSASTEFLNDVQALLDAGIFPVFSAGNNGSGSSTVGSPGSFDISFAVGATTIDDEIASFSSRGPSPWGQIKPEVSAPGKDVRSSLPGGAYGNLSGTSMAAPHASGLAALLLQAAPSLSNNLSNISNVLTSTTVQFGSPVPNNDYGWGRIDAYNAVMSVASVGTMQGAVTQAGSGAPIDNATIQITAHGGGPGINTTTDAAGAYLQGLAADTYDATASAFGYSSSTAFNIQILTNTVTTQDFTLTLKPTGTLSGTVREAGTNLPLVAAISIDGTPASRTSDLNGNYSLTLPTGIYTMTVIAARHRITKAVNITVNDGATVSRDFWLDPAPAILLVDSGKWYQESQIGYYQQTLEALLYPYGTWQIAAPFDTPNDIPTAANLSGYDIVIWSSPEDSPGYIGADAALEEYLDGGGKLLLSGQDVAYYDGGGSILGSAAYLKKYLKAAYSQDDSGLKTINGVSQEPFEGLSLTLAGGDGADNQTTPDVITNAGTDFAGSLLAYDADNLAGLHVGLCVPYRALFLAFGFEGINTLTDRTEVMERAVDWLMASPAQAGVELNPKAETLIGNFGTVMPHTIRLRNTGANADSYNLTYNSNWPVDPVPPANVSLASCQSQVITVGVTVDTTAWHISDTLTLTAQSGNNPVLTDVATRTTKSPAPVLLVDDDRWYSFAAEYQEALEANHIPYDYWLVPKSWSGPVPPSPPLATLQMYPMTVWYTAYDWFQPLTEEEENRLAGYLDGGGRLLFSSQDYIYNLPDHEPSEFAQDYLGVLDHTEDYSSTLVKGQTNNPVGNQLGPYNLTFPIGYNNWTDALTPTTSAQIATLGQAGQPNGVTNSGIGPGDQAWQTAFLAYGPELLDLAPRTRLMQRAVGWLSWLGRSTVTSSVSAALDGDNVTYTATVINNGWENLSTAYFTATRPANLTWETYSSGLSFSGDNLVWTDQLNRNESKVFTYTASIDGGLPLGTVISQTSWLAYPDHQILFDRVATVKVNFPDLNASTMNVSATQDVEAGDTLTYTIVLRNTGLVNAPMVTTTNTLPHMLELVSVDTPGQGAAVSNGNSLTWTTSLAKDEVATLTYRAVISYKTSSAIANTAYASDNLDEPVALTARTTFKTIPTFLPIVFKN